MAVSGVRSSCDTLATKSCRIRPACRKSVMSCSTSTAPPPPDDATAAARATNVRPASRDSGSSRLATFAPQRRADERRDVRVADHLDIRTSGRPAVDAQHLLRRAVDQL